MLLKVNRDVESIHPFTTSLSQILDAPSTYLDHDLIVQRPFKQSPHQNREPTLNLIEPGRMFGDVDSRECDELGLQERQCV
jgi:hypothetical protein